MKNPRTFSDIVYDVEKLIAAVDNNAELLPLTEPLRRELATVAADLRSQRTRRENLRADKQVLSREMTVTSRKALDLSSALRSLIKGSLGVRSEKLTEFDIAPRRQVLRTEKKKRSRATAAPDDAPPL
jgi:hypothetical protein